MGCSCLSKPENGNKKLTPKPSLKHTNSTRSRRLTEKSSAASSTKILQSPAATAVHQNISGIYKQIQADKVIAPGDAHLLQPGQTSSSSTGTSENDELHSDSGTFTKKLKTKTLAKAFKHNIHGRQLSFHVQEAARNGYYNREVVQYKSKLQNFINHKNLPEDQLQVPYLLYYAVKELEQGIRSQRSFRKRVEWVTKGLKHPHLSVEGLYRKTGTKVIYMELLNKILSDSYRHSPLKVHEEIRKHKTNPMNITSMIKTFFAHCLVQPILTAKLLPHFILIIDPDIVNPSNTSLPVPRTTSQKQRSKGIKIKSKSFTRFDLSARVSSDFSSGSSQHSQESNSVEGVGTTPKKETKPKPAYLGVDKLRKLEQYIKSLPVENQHTLSFIMLHLQNVVQNSHNRMDCDSLSISVAPSFIGDLDPYLKKMYKIEQENSHSRSNSGAGKNKIHKSPTLNDCLRRAYSCQANLLKAMLLLDRQFYNDLLPSSKNLYNLLT